MSQSELLAELQKLASNGPLPQKELMTLDDLYNTARTDRLAKDRESVKLKAIEDGANSLLVDQLTKQNFSFANNGYTIALSPVSYVPHVDDWQKLQAHILALGDFSLLEKRIGRAAVQERWDSGAQVPGVEKYPVYKVQRSKQR